MSSSPALDGFHQLDDLADMLGGRSLLVCLDYDGTLCPIVAHPDDAVLDDTMRAALARLADRHQTAIVSGRALDDVRRRVALERLFYAGNHGFEIEGPPGTGLSRRFGEDFLGELGLARDALSRRLRDVPGILIEDKKYTLSVHYRHAPESARQTVGGIVDEVLERHSKLRRHDGKLIFEIRPRIEWHKGKAVQWLREQIDPAAFGIYVGDDVTDEDAFRVLDDEHGLGVLVSDRERPTAARFRVDGVEAVRELLEALAALPGGDRN